jgi:hypothetical protein
VQLAKRVLQDDQRDAVLGQMAVIYPRSLDDVEPGTLARARKEYAKSVQKLLREQQQDAGGGNRQLSEAEMLLLVLKIAFSSFMGGIYVAGAMFNHACRPNLLSQPRPNGALGTCMMATCRIAAGEELTFSYLSPLEQSFGQRCKKFEFQHLCQLASSPWPREMESFSPALEQMIAAGAVAGGGRSGAGDAGNGEEEEEGELTEAQILNVPSVMPIRRKYTRALTFEKFCQG